MKIQSGDRVYYKFEKEVSNYEREKRNNRTKGIGEIDLLEQLFLPFSVDGLHSAEKRENL